MRKSIFTASMLCFGLVLSTLPIYAQVDRDAGDHTLLKLEREGWKIVKDGVLRRELRSNEVETFVYGVEGFTWKLRDLRVQLQTLRTAFQAAPTPELRKAIASHRKEMANTVKMIEQARIAEASDKSGIAEATCDLNYAYNADAGSRNDVQGTWASASSNFNASAECNYSGEVYAYAFARTWLNGADTTETVTDGPRSGANVSATAYASRNGGAPCESHSYASVTSYNLTPSSYSMSKSNFGCFLPLQVSVTSANSMVLAVNLNCVDVTWDVSISGGTPGYTSAIYRNNVFQHYGTSYTETICGNNTTSTGYITIRADVTDSGGQSGSGSFVTTVRYSTLQPKEPRCIYMWDGSQECFFK